MYSFAARFLGACLLLFSLADSRAAAQARSFSVYADGGSGISLGQGQDGTVKRRTPGFIEAGIRTWTHDEPRFVYGGAVRLEIDGRTSFGLVPRVEYVHAMGRLAVRPLAGIPVFLFPFTMIGVELGVGLSVDISDAFAIVGAGMAEVFFWGSDVPQGAVVVMFNGTLGFELEF